jgi:hypothetical protein
VKWPRSFCAGSARPAGSLVTGARVGELRPEDQVDEIVDQNDEILPNIARQARVVGICRTGRADERWPSVKAKVRARTERRYARLPLEWAVEDLNRVLRGWGNYFRYGNSGRKFAQIDSYVNERLAILASAKHGLQGRNWVTRFNYEWLTQLGIHRLNGTVQPTLAYASR